MHSPLMLSKQTSPNMDSRPPFNHQRQNSIPANFEVFHRSPYPHLAPHPHQHTPGPSHRRGISPDHPNMGQQQFGYVYQEQGDWNRQQVSSTNPGHQPQHYTQVAQQQAQARPGLQEQYPNISHHNQPNAKQQLEYVQSLLEQERSKTQRLEHERTLFLEPYEEHNLRMEKSKSDQGYYAHPSSRDGSMVMPNGLLAPFHSRHSEERQRPSSARNDTTGQNGSMSQQITWQQSLQRPKTPENRNSTSEHQQVYFCRTVADEISPGNGPMTPDASAFAIVRPLNMSQRPASPRMTEAMDTDATIKASRSPSKRPALASIFESEVPDMYAQHSNNERSGSLPSPPNTAPLRMSRHFDVSGAACQNVPINLSSPSHHISGPGTPRHHSPTASSPDCGSFNGSPALSRGHFASDVAPMNPQHADCSQFSPQHSVKQESHFDGDMSPYEQGTPSREMCFGDLNFDAVIQETGVSNDAVQSYISAPDQDGKWTCLWEGCGKVHGRKENARAHVQTHLNDRQFKCPHCFKSFVRSHDLKRHAKVHSGVHPHLCPCGRSFGRHDALTRHRQRNCCVGGFEGLIKKSGKRGRPRKQRPDGDDRAEKAAKTRKRAAAKKDETASVSGTSASSLAATSRTGSPLSQAFDLPEYRPAQQDQSSSTFDLASFTRTSLFHTPPLSPQSNTQSGWGSPDKDHSRFSGSPRSTQHDSRRESPELPTHVCPSHTSGPRSHFGSDISSPPELSHSSPPASAKLPDLDFDDLINSSSSGSGNVKAETGERGSSEFEELYYASSPEEMFGDTPPWKHDEGFFNFNDNLDSRDFSVSKFNASFSDDVLFSDGHEMRDGFF